MTIHKEGYSSILISIIIDAAILIPLWLFSDIRWLNIGISVILFVLIMFIARFFRFPNRNTSHGANTIVSPADGKVIEIIEEHDSEYFKDKRLKVSIFMSGFNVHANWIPVSGKVNYVKYHPGRNLFAVHPKSSHLNERASVVIENNGKELLVRQIAGILARRVVTYPKYGDDVKQGGDLGFIKFGSRLDLFFPLGTRILVKEGDVLRGNISELAVWEDN